MLGNLPHLDAAQSVFFARTLEEVDATLYNVRYGKLEALELVTPKPVNPGAESHTYSQYNSRGIAEITSNYATQSKRVDVEGKQYTSYFRSVRLSFGISIQELRNAQFAGVDVDMMKVMAARRGVDEKLNQIALLGAAEHGIYGLYNQPNAQEYTVSADGTGASALWSTKTGELIARDMFGIVDQIPTTTAEVENPKRLLLPYARYRTITTKLMGVSAPNTTVLKHFNEARPGIQVRGALFLETAGAGGLARMIAYDPDPMNLAWLVAVPFEAFPQQLIGMEYVTECHGRCGGVLLRYPLTVCFGDGI